MNIHKNAKLTPKGREEMVRRMQTQPASVVAAGFGISKKQVLTEDSPLNLTFPEIGRAALNHNWSKNTNAALPPWVPPPEKELKLEVEFSTYEMEEILHEEIEIHGLFRTLPNKKPA